jgi:hypothetical protein
VPTATWTPPFVDLDVKFRVQWPIVRRPSPRSAKSRRIEREASSQRDAEPTTNSEKRSVPA